MKQYFALERKDKRREMRYNDCISAGRRGKEDETMGKKLSAVLCAGRENDLVSALYQSGYEPELASDAFEAIERAQPGTAVLVLADEYPCHGTQLTQEMLSAARAKQLKLYVEYPESVLGVPTGEEKTIRYERLVAPDGFCGAMEAGAILMLNGCWYKPYFEKKPGLLCLAKVAGYDRLAFGLPEENVPVLDYLDAQQDVLIAVSALSNFITARYAPEKRWKALLEKLLELLGLGEITLTWKPNVGIEAGAAEPLAPDAIKRSYERNVSWLYDHMITHTPPTAAVLEGFESAIDSHGNQFMRDVIRGDCMGECAMELAYGWRATGDPNYKVTCTQIIEHVLRGAEFCHHDPESSMYGLNNWFSYGNIFYGDDNARMLMGVLSARELLGDDRWDEDILRCVLANLRTSNQDGLRLPRLEASSFKDGKTWVDYYHGEVNYVSPHYQSYLWATFLWMYALTGIEELLERSERAIAIVMERFPDKLRWQNSLTGEIARMILPLAFLYRVKPTEQHKAWLEQSIDAMLEYQEPCGAIRDAFGDLSLGKYPPPRSNENYGTTEASLIQQNGDPATDLLYTTNWAFAGLWEASLVLDDPKVKEAYERLRDFLLRIQVRSEKYPALDGAWLRSFDYDKWEYWGSAADSGWSAWCVETGWVNAWISTVLMLEARGESLMKCESASAFKAIAPRLYEEMFTVRATREVEAAGAEGMPGSAE